MNGVSKGSDLSNENSATNRKKWWRGLLLQLWGCIVHVQYIATNLDHVWWWSESTVCFQFHITLLFWNKKLGQWTWKTKKYIQKGPYRGKPRSKVWLHHVRVQHGSVNTSFSSTNLLNFWILGWRPPWYHWSRASFWGCGLYVFVDLSLSAEFSPG